MGIRLIVALEGTWSMEEVNMEYERGEHGV